ncbi:hypothetical protein P261_00191 [Lachnospiraceae bacterium TWA4]|nr:hypothetical protein P261_00191 [Lachnospiraceae bacterium TWA4]
MNEKAKTTVKDSVFVSLFEQLENTLDLYKILHPEDVSVTKEDIKNVTIQNIFTNADYNDLGFCVRNKLVILVEAQSTWSYNIIIRSLLYLADTWNREISRTNQDKYHSTKLRLSKPEFYVLYTGNRVNKPQWLSLSKDFFKEYNPFLDINIKMLYGETGNDIIS